MNNQLVRIRLSQYDEFLYVRVLVRWRFRFHFKTAVLAFMAGLMVAGPLLILGAIVLGNLWMLL